jgi:ribose transport system substrate-binding protein
MEKFRVLVSLITEDNDYQREQAAAALEAAHKLDLQLEVLYANNDAVNQSLQLMQALQKRPEIRPQAILAEAVGTSMAQAAQTAAAANVAWVLLNRGADYVGALRARTSAPIFCVATDNQKVGQLQGKQINAVLAGEGAILSVCGPSTSDVTMHRTSGMLSTKRHNIPVKTVRGDWTEASAYRAVKSWLKLSSGRDANIALVAAQNDAMAMGARRAIEEMTSASERNRLLKLPFLGCDGIESKGQKYVQTGLLRGTVVTPPLTSVALEMLVKAMRLHSQPAEQTLIAPRPYPSFDAALSS